MSRILVIALICLLVGQALVLFTVVSSPSPSAPKEPQECKVPAPKPLPRVLLAAADLGPGALLNEHLVAWHPWPEEAIGDAYIREGSADAARVMGTVVRAEITNGEPITWHKVVDRADGGALSLILQPGLRAATIPTDDVTGDAGLIRAGDRVDLILIMALDKDAQGNPVSASETVLEDLRVLAVNDNLRSLVADDRRRGGNQQATVTVEVTPRQAAMIALAQKMGQVTVSVRGLNGAPTTVASADTPGGTPPQSPVGPLWGQDVTPDLAPYLKKLVPNQSQEAAAPSPSAQPAPAPASASAPATTTAPATDAAPAKKGVLLIRGHDVQTIDVGSPEN